MPSDNYNHFSDTDLADIVAYVRSVASVDSNLPSSDIRPLGRLLFAAGQLPLMPAASIDRGKTWTKFAANFPTVPVFDLQIHPRDHELIAATHGRSLWIVDIAALEQMTPKTYSAGTHLFAPKTSFPSPSVSSGSSPNATERRRAAFRTRRSSGCSGISGRATCASFET